LSLFNTPLEGEHMSSEKTRGNWGGYSLSWQYGQSVHLVPLSANLPRLDWLQRFLTVWGKELKSMNTQDELENAFYDIFIQYLFFVFKDSPALPEFLDWERSNCGVPYGRDFYRQRYKNLHSWTTATKKTHWENFYFWIYIDEITIDACLSLLKNKNRDFPSPIMRVERGIIEWLVELAPYESVDVQYREK
jgi:hypothetical protein